MKCFKTLVNLNISSSVTFNQRCRHYSAAGIYCKTLRTRKSCSCDSLTEDYTCGTPCEPDAVKNCESLSGFKNQLKKFYFLFESTGNGIAGI